MSLKHLHIGIVDILRLKLFSIFIGATLKGKNTLPLENIFFPLVVTPFKIGLSRRGNILYYFILFY